MVVERPAEVKAGALNLYAPKDPDGARRCSPGRRPQMVAAVVASLTADPAGTRCWVAETSTNLRTGGRTAQLPGLRTPPGTGRGADTVVAGEERTPAAAVRAFADFGATELQLIPAGPPADRERTIAFLASLADGREPAGPAGNGPRRQRLSGQFVAVPGIRSRGCPVRAQVPRWGHDDRCAR